MTGASAPGRRAALGSLLLAAAAATYPPARVVVPLVAAVWLAGTATMTLNVPAGAPITGLPVELNHAFAIIDYATASASYASNPTVIRLVP